MRWSLNPPALSLKLAGIPAASIPPDQPETRCARGNYDRILALNPDNPKAVQAQQAVFDRVERTRTVLAAGLTASSE